MADAAYNIENLVFLVVEDNPNMLSLVRSILNTLGAKTVREASDGPSAIEDMRVYRPDIIICDWHMEPMNGLDFVKLIRGDQSGPNRLVPIIMLTAHSEIARVKEARDCGVTEFLVKPISAKSLYTRIREIIAHPRPFVSTPDYFGPDRRRKQIKISFADRRMEEPELLSERPPGFPVAD
jgi:CheY-like chemotaxis protein